MAKNLKLTIKNTQIAEAINLGALKSKLAKKKAEEHPAEEKAIPSKKEEPPVAAKSAHVEEAPKEEAPRIRARSKSVFAEHPQTAEEPHAQVEQPIEVIQPSEKIENEADEELKAQKSKTKTSAEIRKELFAEELAEVQQTAQHPKPTLEEAKAAPVEAPKVEKRAPEARPVPPTTPPKRDEKRRPRKDKPLLASIRSDKSIFREPPPAPISPREKLGPTGKHIKDLLPPPPPPRPQAPREARPQQQAPRPAPAETAEETATKAKNKPKGRTQDEVAEEDTSKKAKAAKFKEFRDLKPARRQDSSKDFDARARQGLRDVGEEEQWRKRRQHKMKPKQEEVTVRPSSLKIRTPISIKDLAAEMKLKASQLIAKLFLHGLVITLNDLLEDETTLQLLGQEFGCDITIDTSEKERIRITDKSIKEEVQQSDPQDLQIRPPVVAFMGHVDHGKTSLIDSIRKSNRTSGEAGAITQHIGAFLCKTAVGDIAVLDTPGHEAFSAMRARGADVTDIVVLVVAGDEGIRQQTLEAIEHARSANVTIVVALNKCDKPNFNPENVYRQLSEIDLLPEAWGGQIITVNCSAVTGEGIQTLLEMLALQAEVLELKANPKARARGSVLESKMHKGLGPASTVLVQNGTLKLGDPVVFGNMWGRVKTMRDEFNKELTEAGPSTPVEITGLSGLPEAGQEFIVVKSERDAREIAEMRLLDFRQSSMLLQQKKKITMESFLEQSSQPIQKKILNIVLRADVQGSLEALRSALNKIQSQKAELNIIYGGIGEISESDVQLAAASKAVILGFHTQIESHAEQLLKEQGIQVRLHDIIYHAVDDVKALMANLLDKIPIETEKGKAEVKATFKSSQVGTIAGCQVIEGIIQRNNHIRVKRAGEMVWKGTISSLKRVKEDVREVQKGMECGILLNGYADVKQGDIMEAYEVTYISQEL